MRQDASVFKVLSTLLVVLFSAPATLGQLSLDWSLDLTHLQAGSTIPKSCMKIDDDGNVYVAYNDNGLGVIKVRPDKSIAYETVYPSSEDAVKLYVGPSGEVYVVAAQIVLGETEYIKVLRFEPSGTFSWEHTFGHPKRFTLDSPVVDHLGNLWMAVAEFVFDPPCLDSSFQMLVAKGTAGGVSTVHTFRGTHLNGGAYPYSINPIIADMQGNINVMTGEGAVCYDPTCHPDSTIPLCYVDHNGEETIYWSQLSIRKLSAGGGLIGTTRLYTSDNPSDQEDTRHSIYGDQQGEVIAVSTYRPDPDVWTVWRTTVAYNGWKITLPNRQESGVLADHNNDLYIATINVDGSKGAEYEVPIMYKLSGINGSVLWTGDGWSHQLGVDLDNNIYTSPGKVAPDGTVLWNWPNLGAPGNIASLIGIDDQHNHFHMDGINKVLYKFVEDTELTINDVNGDPMADMEFTLCKVTFGAPVFNLDTLGKFTTDADGKITLEADTEGAFAIELNTGRHLINRTDELCINKHIHTEPARRRSKGMFNLYLDNARFEANGAMSYPTLDECTAEGVTMDHTEIRYNLWVSIEWRASQAYIGNLYSGLMNFSNYLYDVTDGQVRIDTVTVMTGGAASVLSDIYVKASNVEWAHCENGVGGIWQRTHETYKRIIMPRKFYGDTVTNRANSYSEGVGQQGVLDVNTPTDYRTKVHEFGHYAFGFYDEYLFWNNGTLGFFQGYERDDGSGNLRCRPRDEMTYGFMDYQYDYGQGVALGYSSEMSSKYRYQDAACRNTKQYRERGRSCWDHLEVLFETTDWGPDLLRVPILKPDFDDDDERHDLSPINTFVGPNNDLQNPNYDVGARLVLVDQSYPSAPDYVNKSIRVAGVPGLDRCDVQLINKPGDANGRRTYYQGRTSDEGLIWVLGVYEADFNINVTKRQQIGRWTTTKSGAAQSINSSGSWTYGSISSISGDSAVIELQQVSGDYPMLIAAAVDVGSTTVDLIAESPLLEIPTLDLITTDSGMFSYDFGTISGGYSTMVSNEMGGEGQLVVNAVDGDTEAFFFYCPYRKVDLASDTAATVYSVSAPSGMAEVLIDTVNSALTEALIVSSGYPVPLAGAGDQAVQVGPAYTLALLPELTLDSANQILIRYSEDDLLVEGGTLAGMESMLEVYRWDDVSSVWAPLTSAVDTLGNMVAAPIDRGGAYALFTSQVISDVGDDGYGQTLPYRFELEQNYPNPFNPATTIEYNLPRRSHVTIEVYNVLGQKVRTLVNREESAGLYSITWDSKDASGKPVSTGVYLYRFQAGDHVETKKMLLLK